MGVAFDVTSGSPINLMTHLMKSRFTSLFRSRYGLFAVAIALLFALIYSSVSIYSALKMNANLEVLNRRSYLVVSHLQEIRKELTEMEVYVGRLTDDNTKSNRRLVDKVIDSSKSTIGKSLEYVYAHYLGARKDIAGIDAALKKLYEEQDKVLQLALKKKEGLGALIYGDFAVYYEKVDDKILKAIDLTGQKRTKVAEDSMFMVAFNVTVSVVLSVLMVILVFLVQRMAYRRIQERRFHDDVLQIISDNAGHVFLLYNFYTGEMEYVSPNAFGVLGIQRSVLKRYPLLFVDRCSPDRAAEIGKWFNGVDVLKHPVFHEVQFTNPETGSKRWISISIYPVREKDNSQLRCIFSITDLSDIKQAQQVLKDALFNAEKANEAKSSFLSRMSHEIRTPMNAIIGMTTIAATVMNDRAKLENCLSKIALSSRHLLMLINDVLDVSKIESGKMTVTKDPFELGELMQNIGSIIYSQAITKKQHFEIVTNVRHETLRGDILRLNQILINILSNAVKFTPENGRVRLQVEEIAKRHTDQIWLRFTISDSGRGMSPEFLNRLFMPFEQENDGSGKLVEGTGLGMPITKNLVTLMNGTINVESVPGKGTVFTVEIGFDNAGDGKEKRSGVLEELKILVVDDDADTCEHTTIILDRMGMKAEWVLSGQEAVQKVVGTHRRHDGYDVVFVDWKMPDMDGIETTRRIRQEVGSEALIIIISAYDWSDIEKEARLAGANAFISKPMLQSNMYQTLVSVTRETGRRGFSCDVPKNPVASLLPFGNNSGLSGKHVLVAEDNGLNQEIVEELLKTVGISVDIARNGNEAVNKFASSSPGTYDLVLMDIQMPYLDGYEATRAIRALSHPDAKRVPVVAMTANVFADDVAKARAAGMNAHLGKPVDMKLLYQMICEQLEKSENES